MVIGFEAGGGTDISGRRLAPYLTKYLPGAPAVVVQNQPGADGLVATNFFAQQAKPDGLTIEMGATTIIDPVIYRTPQAKFDPTKFAYVGGVGRGGSVLLISTEAAKRLRDKNAPPVVMGSLIGIPHATMQATAWGIEFLGWNARWVTGYHGTPDIIVALERGEIDMSATGNIDLINRLVNSGKFEILVQTGTLEQGKVVPRTEFGQVPMFSKLLDGNINDPIQRKGFDYWYALLSSDKWLALPPNTPAPIVAAHREAFKKISKDPEFLDRAKKVSEDLEMQPAADMEATVKTLGSTPPEALDYITAMLSKQGIGSGK